MKINWSTQHYPRVFKRIKVEICKVILLITYVLKVGSPKWHAYCGFHLYFSSVKPGLNRLCNTGINKGLWEHSWEHFSFLGFFSGSWVVQRVCTFFSISCARVSFLLANFLFECNRGFNNDVLGCVYFIVRWHWGCNILWDSAESFWSKLRGRRSFFDWTSWTNRCSCCFVFVLMIFVIQIFKIRSWIISNRIDWWIRVIF